VHGVLAHAEPEDGRVQVLRQRRQRYLQYKADKGKRSIKEDRRIVRKRLVPYFGAETPIADITEAKIAGYEVKRVGEVSIFTTCNELSILKALLRLARRWGYITQVPDIELPKKPDNRERYLSQEEIDRLLPICGKSKNPYLLTVVIVALNTGMRKEEILSLTWERINFSTATITLYQTKSGKARGVPLNGDLERALLALEPNASQRHGLLFKKKADGSKKWGQIRTAWETALGRAGITNFRFHDTRHTFSSWFVMRGGSIQELKEILGHSDLKMTLRYAHLSTQHLRASMGRMEGLTSAHVSSHRSSQSAKLAADRLVSSHAPVAQVDRAAVS
jgi:integrase